MRKDLDLKLDERLLDKEPKEIVDEAERYAKRCSNISNSRLRKIFDCVSDLHSLCKEKKDRREIEYKLQELRILIAYLANREKGDKKNLLLNLENLVKNVDLHKAPNELKVVSKLYLFFEALIAFHKDKNKR